MLKDYSIKTKDKMIRNETMTQVKHLVEKMSAEESMEEGDFYPGLEVAVKHQLAPNRMQLTINVSDDIYSTTYKYMFYYSYLDLTFNIKTNDDKVAARLYPSFNEAQRTQIMAMTLSSKVE